MTVNDRRAELEICPRGRELGALRDLLHDYRDFWGITAPARQGEFWTADPRRRGLSRHATPTIAKLRSELEAAAARAGITEIRALEEQFPRWTVWRSDGGFWWATRRELLTDQQLDVGLHATIGDVSKASQLLVLLLEQYKLEEWAEIHPGQIPGEQARKELGLPATADLKAAGRPETRAGVPLLVFSSRQAGRP